MCDNPACLRPRLLYSIDKPSASLMKQMDAYAESISYQCGDPLFEEHVTDEKLVELKDTFFAREAISCKDRMQVAGRFLQHGRCWRTHRVRVHLLNLRCPLELCGRTALRAAPMARGCAQ